MPPLIRSVAWKSKTGSVHVRFSRDTVTACGFKIPGFADVPAEKPTCQVCAQIVGIGEVVEVITIDGPKTYRIVTEMAAARWLNV